MSAILEVVSLIHKLMSDFKLICVCVCKLFVTNKNRSKSCWLIVLFLAGTFDHVICYSWLIVMPNFC